MRRWLANHRSRRDSRYLARPDFYPQSGDAFRPLPGTTATERQAALLEDALSRGFRFAYYRDRRGNFGLDLRLRSQKVRTKCAAAGSVRATRRHDPVNLRKWLSV